MNKLTKQLLSLGLSAVTVAGMVTPVLADDEVPTTEPTEEITEVSEQPTEVDVVEQPSNITEGVMPQTDEMVTVSNGDVGTTNDNVVSTKAAKRSILVKLNLFNDGYFVYCNSDYKEVTINVDEGATEYEVQEYISKNCIPDGYVVIAYGMGAAGGYEIYPNEDGTVYTVNCIKKEKQINYADTAYKQVNFIGENGEIVATDHFRLKRDADKITTSDIERVPYGYIVPGLEYEIDKESGVFNVPVEKRDPKDLVNYVNLNLLYFQDGKYNIYDAPYLSYAPEFDLNKDNKITYRELKKFFENRYKDIEVLYDDDMLDFSAYDYSSMRDTKPRYIEVFVKIKSYVNQPMASTDAAKAELPKDTEKFFTNSLKLEENKDLKKKYDEEVAAGRAPKIIINSKSTDSVDVNDKNALREYAQKFSLGEGEAFTIDVALVSCEGETLGYLTKLSEPLTFKINIPEDLKKDGRNFYVLREHNGVITKLNVSEDGTFTTDQFSSYMLVYEDVKETTPETKPEVKPETKPEVKPAAKPSIESTTTTTDTKKNNTVKKDVKKNKKVNTSTKTSGTLFTGLLGVSIIGLGAVEVLRRRNK